MLAAFLGERGDILLAADQVARLLGRDDEALGLYKDRAPAEGGHERDHREREQHGGDEPAGLGRQTAQAGYGGAELREHVGERGERRREGRRDPDVELPVLGEPGHVRAHGRMLAQLPQLKAKTNFFGGSTEGNCARCQGVEVARPCSATNLAHCGGWALHAIWKAEAAVYLRHATVRKNGKNHTYWRLVGSVRRDGKVRQ